MMNFLC